MLVVTDSSTTFFGLLSSVFGLSETHPQPPAEAGQALPRGEPEGWSFRIKLVSLIIVNVYLN